MFFSLIIYGILSIAIIKYETTQYNNRSVVIFLFSSITFSTFLKANVTVFYAIALGALIDINNFELLLFSVILGIMLMVTYKPFASRTEILNKGILLGGISSVVLLSLKFFNTQEFSIEIIYPIIIGSLLGTTVIIGIFPYLEKILGTTTSTRSSELTKHDHPLIKRLVNEANDTYHHSIRVANMSEIAAEKIGSNYPLVKIAAYFTM